MEEENENLVVNFKNINAENSNPAGTLPVKATVIEPDANKGIVIKDKNNNEWVWIEVPKDAAFSGLEIDTTKTLTSKDYEVMLKYIMKNKVKVGQMNGMMDVV